jgi:hypothetical protein
MNTLEVLENFSRLCDELAAAMQAENAALRSVSGSRDDAAARQRENSARLDAMLAEVRQASPSGATERTKVRACRDRVMQKILKLMLLSRESEQLLLRPQNRPAPSVVGPTPSQVAQVASAYQAVSR